MCVSAYISVWSLGLLYVLVYTCENAHSCLSLRRVIFRQHFTADTARLAGSRGNDSAVIMTRTMKYVTPINSHIAAAVTAAISARQTVTHVILTII